MFRGLILGAVAVGVGMFAASLLRTERLAAGGSESAPSGGGSCAARTKSGAACSRPAEPGSDFCWQHS